MASEEIETKRIKCLWHFFLTEAMIDQEKTTENKKYLSVKSAAKYLDLPLKTIYHWAQTQEDFPYHRIGKRMLINKEELDQFVEKHRVVHRRL